MRDCNRNVTQGMKWLLERTIEGMNKWRDIKKRYNETWITKTSVLKKWWRSWREDSIVMNRRMSLTQFNRLLLHLNSFWCRVSSFFCWSTKWILIINLNTAIFSFEATLVLTTDFLFLQRRCFKTTRHVWQTHKLMREANYLSSPSSWLSDSRSVCLT